MKSWKQLAGALVLTVLLAPGLVSAASPKQYQVTGKVLEVTETTIVVEKNDEKWVLIRDAKTKVEGDLKVGAKVTIQYSMTATTVEVKGEKADKAK